MGSGPRSVGIRVVAAGGSVAVLALLGALWSGWNFVRHDGGAAPLPQRRTLGTSPLMEALR